MAKSLTAANSIYTLAIPGVFSSPVQLQGFSADDIFDTDSVEAAETSMGVDGRLSGGFIFVSIKQGIVLQADSNSNDVFDQWYAAQQLARDLYYANGVVILPSINRKWSMGKGILKTYPPTPGVGKVLKPRKFGIEWERVEGAPV